MVYKSLDRALEENDVLQMHGLWDAPKALLAARLREKTEKTIVIVTSGQRESRLFDDFPYFTDQKVREFPAWETLPSEEIPPSPDIVGERLSVLRALMNERLILLCPLQAVVQQVPKEFVCIHISSKKELPFTEFVHQLSEMGYVRRPIVVEKGEFAVRGGMIDIFPVDLPDPYRIEFWGDQIEAVRTFDPVGQKSTAKVDELSLLPAKEAQEISFWDYLGEEAILIFDDFEALQKRSDVLGLPLGPLVNLPLQKIYWGNGEGVRWKHPYKKVSEVFPGDDLLLSLEGVVDRGLHLTFLCETHSEEEKLRENLRQARVILPSDTAFKRGYLSSGYVDDSRAIVPMTEFTHRYKVRRQKMRSTLHTAPIDYMELKPGDYVVHYHSGVARYLGCEMRPDVSGIKTEYLVLEFAERGRLYVPLTRSNLVSKYIGAKEETPRLSLLGSNRWERTRKKTEGAIRDYAQELLKLHAERELAQGYAYAPDSEELKELEADFPYEETDDQIKAIADVKRDMIAPQPMDRLICGDVGYGKTEVAMRAAFKAVVDGPKQVAVLVPTTVLAMQHFETFCDRMSNTAVTIGVLSRFVTPKEQRKTLEGVKSGAIDILIGTHRILSKDVAFNNLGLIVIDEEQKFGVRVKEKLRAFKHGVDCLTLTATPIPRTLYLSMMGARDLSVINTPPQDRIPIKTVVTEIDSQTLRTALLRELTRDGQAYFIHNRVETITGKAKYLQELLPDARILVGHGQMSSGALDEVFHQFKRGEADILVATTIIENGIDIPNANTILIDRADCFGLADLYQLRGRVGRWNRRAYAYFLTPKNREIAEISQKRLAALIEISGYGGGMRLAMRDLEIRGAGNILGTKQSGHVSAVGFHLYCKLLKRTIAAFKGELPTAVETKLDFPLDARLPDTYINEPTLRMEVYQRFGEAVSELEVDALFAEIQDRFGRPPEPVIWLYHLMRIRVFASNRGIRRLQLKGSRLTIDQHTRLIQPSNNPKTLEKQITSAVQLSHGERP